MDAGAPERGLPDGGLLVGGRESGMLDNAGLAAGCCEGGALDGVIRIAGAGMLDGTGTRGGGALDGAALGGGALDGAALSAGRSDGGALGAGAFAEGRRERGRREAASGRTLDLLVSGKRMLMTSAMLSVALSTPECSLLTS